MGQTAHGPEHSLRAALRRARSWICRCSPRSMSGGRSTRASCSTWRRRTTCSTTTPPRSPCTRGASTRAAGSRRSSRRTCGGCGGSAASGVRHSCSAENSRGPTGRRLDNGPAELLLSWPCMQPPNHLLHPPLRPCTASAPVGIAASHTSPHTRAVQVLGLGLELGCKEASVTRRRGRRPGRAASSTTSWRAPTLCPTSPPRLKLTHVTVNS